MSLILEALKKSEQQRQAGGTPTLVSESAWAARRIHGAPRRRSSWLWLLLPAVLLAVGGAWYVLRPQAAPSDAAATPPVSAASEPVAAAPPALAPAPSNPLPETPPQVAMPAPPSAASISTPTALPPAPPAAQGEPAAASISAQPALAPAEAAPPLAAPPPAPLPSVASVPVAAAAPTPEVAAVAMDAVLSPPEAPAMNTPPAPALPPAIAAAPDKPDGLPWAYELPLALRQALPPMKLSMHVWNADPARRFVILDDTRAAEGGPAGKDLTVIEIRREALVLEFRGARFLLPRGGY